MGQQVAHARRMICCRKRKTLRDTTKGLAWPTGSRTRGRRRCAGWRGWLACLALQPVCPGTQREDGVHRQPLQGRLRGVRTHRVLPALRGGGARRAPPHHRATCEAWRDLEVRGACDPRDHGARDLWCVTRHRPHDLPHDGVRLRPPPPLRGPWSGHDVGRGAIDDVVALAGRMLDASSSKDLSATWVRWRAAARPRRDQIALRSAHRPHRAAG